MALFNAKKEYASPIVDIERFTIDNVYTASNGQGTGNDPIIWNGLMYESNELNGEVEKSDTY